MVLQILKQIFNNLRLNYYTSRYFNELKKAADSHYETMKDFVIKMGSQNLSKIYEITREIQYNKFNIDLTYEQFIETFFTLGANSLETKYWVINHYGINTWQLFLRAGGLDETPLQSDNANKLKDENTLHNYAKEIQKYLGDLGCTLTKAGYMSAMALKHDRSPLDQAIGYCVSAVAEGYFKNLIQQSMNGHTHLITISDKIKNYYETGKISKFAYQSTISILSSCINPNKTEDEKDVLESLIKQNYLGDEKLVFITE